MTGRPVRITFPPYDIGAAGIVAGGKYVGLALDEGRGRWRAYLFPSAQDRRMPRPAGCEEVTARTLGELRRVLRERLELKGPWWTG